MNNQPKFLISTFIIASMILSGCNSTNHQNHQSHNQTTSENLTVSFQANPAKSNLGEPITFQSTVKQGNQGVTTAKVEFEVWKDASSNHKQYPAKHVENGDYIASDSFAESGKYNVVVHVYTEKDHKMTEGTFQVGQTSAKHESQSHHHNEKTRLHLMLPQSPQAGKSTVLTGHVMDPKGNPLPKAEVEFEIWKEGVNKHQYVEAKEKKDGEYVKIYTFPEPGIYHVQLHVEKPSEKLHEHIEKTITVQK